jgi:hypothetical protein
MMDLAPEESRRARILLLVLLAFVLAQAAILIPVRRTWFHWGMLAEDLLLLAGTWMLSGSLFRSSFVRFFVSAAALGSTLWMDPAARCFTALPLVLALARRFMETGARRWALGAGLLAVLPLPGQPAAVALLLLPAAALCWVGAAILWEDPLRAKWRDLRWTRTDALLPIAIVLAGTANAIARWPSPGDSAGPPALQAWLVGSGFRYPLQYLDLALGISSNADATSFCGMFTTAFALCALAGAGHRRSLLLLAFLAVSLALVGLVAMVFPSRPPAAGVALLRFVVIALAGLGFDRCLERGEPGRVGMNGAGGFLLVVGVISTGLSLLSWHLSSIEAFFTSLLSSGATVDPLWNQQFFAGFLGTSALMAGAAGATLRLWHLGGRRASLALALILVLHPLDTFGWRFRHTWARSTDIFRLTPAQARAGAELHR